MARYLKQASIQRGTDLSEVRQTVTAMLEDIRAHGEQAVRRYSQQLDQWDPEDLRVSADAVRAAERDLPESLKESIRFTAAQVERFARLQRDHVTDFEEETLPGVWLGQKTIPVASVGSYTPGGRYPLIASAIMTITTPRVAGVERVVAASPAAKGKGGIHPPTLYAMSVAGATDIYALGGVQAMAAMAFGALPGLDPVDVIVGAGNAYVAEAKRQLFGDVGIDLLAGPTEILVLADEHADPEVVATDILSQAEHDPRSPSIVVTTSEQVGQLTAKEIDRLLQTWPTANVAAQSWAERGEIVACDSPEEAVEVADGYAPEHLEVLADDWRFYLDRLRNYGSLFLGEEATVTYGDKSVGTNHVLPTGRAARYTGGLWVGKFLKTVTYQRMTREGSVTVAQPGADISHAEGMHGHALAAELRIKRYSSQS